VASSQPLVVGGVADENLGMEWREWRGDLSLEMARDLTEKLRSADEPDDYPRLRRALTKDEIDPSETILADLFPDGGSDFGILIRPDGMPCRVDVWWGDEAVSIEPMPDPSDWSAYGPEIYAGWSLHMHQGLGEVDLISALVPGIRSDTQRFREGNEEMAAHLPPRGLDWSLAEALMRNESADPGRVVAISTGRGVSTVRGLFLLPDHRVFMLEADMDEESRLSAVTEWREFNEAEIVETCGPLYVAALRIVAEEQGPD
jgi:hypothetical protein